MQCITSFTNTIKLQIYNNLFNKESEKNNYNLNFHKINGHNIKNC